MSATMSLSPSPDILVGERAKNTSPRERIAAALRRAVAYSPSPAKELARRLNLTPNGAALLLRGESSPRAETLMLACREFDAVWDTWQQLAERPQSSAEERLDEITRLLRERRRA